jgi:hypothetical protein
MQYSNMGTFAELKIRNAAENILEFFFREANNCFGIYLLIIPWGP